MLLTREDGIAARTPEEAQQALLAGYVGCTTQFQPSKTYPQGYHCTFMLSPETQHTVEKQGGGYYTCPVCRVSHDLLHEMPWWGVDPETAQENDRSNVAGQGGATHIGLTLAEQGEIGESLVRNLGELPGYGAFTWFHEGGANAPSPLDAATKDWGVEIKTLGYDAAHHRFIPGRATEKNDKNAHAAAMNKLGVLGVLVLLDYRRSVADIYVREYPLANGVGAFRSHNAEHLVKEVPFRNPLMDPHSPSPQVEHSPIESEPMPF